MSKSLPVLQPNQRPAGAPPIFGKIGIVGLGLICGSIALRARELWPSALVIAVDEKDVLETAMRLHAIDVAADDLIVLAEADLVVWAAPVPQNIELLQELDDNVRQPAIITDTGSTKRDVVAAAATLPPRFTFIGGARAGGAAAATLHVHRRAPAGGRGAGRARARAPGSFRRPALDSDDPGGERSQRAAGKGGGVRAGAPRRN